MRLFTEREQIRRVADRYAAQYPDGSQPAHWRPGDRIANVLADLRALDVETATAADVARAMGGAGWVAPVTCNECREHSWSVVELGEEPDYDSATARICESCLRKALRALECAADEEYGRATVRKVAAETGGVRPVGEEVPSAE